MRTKLSLLFAAVLFSFSALAQLGGTGDDVECSTCAFALFPGQPNLPTTLAPVGALNAGDAAVINITNSGLNGASLNGPGFGGAAGNMCVNMYAFSPDEQLISCCSCLVTPNALVSVSLNNDLLSNTLTGIRPNSVVVSLIGSLAGPGGTGTSCTNSAALVQRAAGPFPVARGMLGWGTTVHQGVPAGTFAVNELPFKPASLGDAQLASLTGRCANIIGNGSSFGLCRSCRAGGLGQSGGALTPTLGN